MDSKKQIVNNATKITFEDMCRSILTIIICCFCVWHVSSQELDSIRYSLGKKPTFLFSFDARRSFVFAENAKIGGIKIGLDYDKKIRFGLGLYTLTSPFYRTIITDGNNGNIDTTHTQFEFGYFSPYTEYVLFHNKRWEFSIPIQLGLGAINLRDTLIGSSFKRQNITLLEASLIGHYKFLNWLGLGVGAGHRQMLTRNKIIESSLTAPIYIIKLKMFFGVIYRSVFPENEEDKDR